MMRRVRILPLYFLWALFALYPNPTLLARSVPQGWNPTVDPAAVAAWSAELPDDPTLIERSVLDHYVPYSVPWQSYGVPWYYPTTREVVTRGQGDCQARALVLASILERKGLPYRLEASFDHIWVWYPQKAPSAMENQSIALLTNDGAGSEFQVPEQWNWRESWRIEREYFWDAMPIGRKLLFFGGLLLIRLRSPVSLGIRRLVPVVAFR
ncbi:MAG: transglutaminase domain-containing protein [Chloroflexota bacterium]|nr:transglutaminase domain-containing protein [Chloroflexota bacterium]